MSTRLEKHWAQAVSSSSFTRGNVCIHQIEIAMCRVKMGAKPAAGFAVVKLATERATGGEYAVKIMSLPERGRSVGDNENSRDDIFKEIDILVGLNHPNVIYLREYFEENNRVRTCTPCPTVLPLCSTWNYIYIPTLRLFGACIC